MTSGRALRPRLLPVVIAAGSGLLLLKVMGLWLNGGYVIAPPQPAPQPFGHGLTQVRADPAYARDALTTGSTPAKKPDADKAGPKDAGKAGKDGKVEAPSQPLPPALPSASERQVLEHLGARRQQLEDKSKELELREQMLKSAEKMLQDKIGDLKSTEAKADASSAKDSGGDIMRPVVVMYEAMKPRDAAKVFEKMAPGQLAPLARQMNPRKLSEILAQMAPESAEKLTQMLLRPASAALPSRPAVATPVEELPRLPSHQPR